jgi:hypothetical protein
MKNCVQGGNTMSRSEANRVMKIVNEVKGKPSKLPKEAARDLGRKLLAGLTKKRRTKGEHDQ